MPGQAPVGIVAGSSGGATLGSAAKIGAIRGDAS